ncbi:TPA: hypothetical protein ML375_002937 [Klebsiella variicola]|nr:hypothetical protein [Klebsiella variicola]
MKKIIIALVLAIPMVSHAMDYCRVMVPDAKGVRVDADGKISNDGFGAAVYVGERGQVSRYEINPVDGSIMEAAKNAYHYNDDAGHSITLNWDGFTVETVQFIPDSHRYLFAQQYMPDAIAKSHNFKSSAIVQSGSWHDCNAKTINAIYSFKE